MAFLVSKITAHNYVLLDRLVSTWNRVLRWTGFTFLRFIVHDASCSKIYDFTNKLLLLHSSHPSLCLMYAWFLCGSSVLQSNYTDPYLLFYEEFNSQSQGSLRHWHIKLWLVTSAKQHQYPCSGPPHYWKCILNFLSTWLANQQGLLQQTNHSRYPNRSTQVSALNKDFGAVLQKDLTRSLVPAVAPVIPRVFSKTGIGCRCLAYNKFFWIFALFTSNRICTEFVCFNLVP